MSARPVVLVVEDEPLLRINAAESIREAGFEVIEARNADEAIAVLEDRFDIHVVFTDIPDARLHGRVAACSFCPSPMASCEDHRYVRSVADLGRRFTVARQSGWEHSDNQDGHFGGRGGRMIVAARR